MINYSNCLRSNNKAYHDKPQLNNRVKKKIMDLTWSTTKSMTQSNYLNKNYEIKSPTEQTLVSQ